MKKNKIIYLLLFLLSISILYMVQLVFMPKYINDIQEGNLVEEYYLEETNHDVLFIGDCEVFSNISPITLWENYGITSYIRGSAQQLIWHSYYLLEDALRYEKPKLVVYNVLAMKYNEPQKEAYNRLTLDGMKLSGTKLNAIKASMMEDETLLSYLFPLLRYHSRWSELSKDDFKYAFNKDIVSHNGYLMRVDTLPVGYLPRERRLADYEFGENSYGYLDKITKLCKDNDIELILMKSPSVYPYWHDEWDQQITNFAEENNLEYINFLDHVDIMDIDYQEDTFDGGLHLNLSGAEKFTNYFGGILDSKYDLLDHRSNKDLKGIWDEKVNAYYEMKKSQEKELEMYGYLKSVGNAAQNMNE